MSGGHPKVRGVHDEDGQAIRGFDGKQFTRALSEASVRMGRLSPRCRHDDASMDLVQEEDIPRRPEGLLRRFTRDRACSRYPLSEAVNETRDVREQGGGQEIHRSHIRPRTLHLMV